MNGSFKDVNLFTKFSDLSLYSMGVIFSTGGTIAFLYGLASNDSEMISGGKEFTGIGLSFISLISGNYLERINLKDPPKKPKRKKVKEWLKEKIVELTPSPLPSPVSNYSNASLDTIVKSP